MNMPLVAVLIFLAHGSPVGGIVVGAADSPQHCKELAYESLEAHKAETVKMLQAGAEIRAYCVDADSKALIDLTEANLPEQTGKQSFVAPRDSTP